MHISDTPGPLMGDLPSDYFSDDVQIGHNYFVHVRKYGQVQDRGGYRRALEQAAFRHGKMAFLSGPRQAGKPTLAKLLGESYPRTEYYTWDDPTFRRQWIKDPTSLLATTVEEKSLLILDELHKAPRWKNNLKALFDLRGEFAHILVTGRARMDVFPRGGDSLVGRYFPFRLHPFSMGELLGDTVPPKDLISALARKRMDNQDQLVALHSHEGFPEPFLKQDETFTLLWRRMRNERLIREDLRDISHAQDLANIEAMSALIPERVGSPFSLQSIVEDLGIAHPTAKRWLECLGIIHVVYTVSPYTKSLARALRKQPKVYLWDWSEVTDEGARFENLIAGHLRKACDAWNDTGLGNFDLCYVRDKEKREVDFLITDQRKPWLLVECKMSDPSPAPPLAYFARFLRSAAVLQIIAKKGAHITFDVDGIPGYVISAGRILPLLP